MFRRVVCSEPAFFLSSNFSDVFYMNSFHYEHFSTKEQEIIRAEALPSEQKGQWTDTLHRLAAGRRLFHIMVPEKYGGLQMELPSALSLLEEASRLDGSFGWTLTLGAGAGVFAAFMEPALAEEHFQQDEAFIAGSGYPSGTADQREEDYRVNGRWKYASGSPFATLFTASCMLTRNGVLVKRDEQPLVKAVALLPEEIEFTSSWKSFGLKATASRDFKVDDTYIPEQRVFELHPDRSHINGPLYRFPFLPFAQCTLAASMAGIGGHFLEEAIQLLESKMERVDSAGSQWAKKRIAEAQLGFTQARDQLFESVETAWHPYNSGSAAPESRLDAVESTSRNMAAAALRAAYRLYPLCGMSVLDPDSAINRAWRDLHTASQHAFLSPVD